MSNPRKIIHVDMDAFFASVEQRDYPHLRGKPVAVGGLGERGVIAAASYEARVFGVRSAMPSSVAKRKCPHLIFVKHRFDQYKAVSRQIREIFEKYTNLVEPLSLDEAFLDVTHNKLGLKSAMFIAQEIKREIFDETQLTASAGVSINKFVAKIASDMNKPNGITTILPEEVIPFIEKLDVNKFFGVGKVTGEKMKRLNINTGADLKKLSALEMNQHFGKLGNYLYDAVRGIDLRPVQANRIRKSFSNETTYSYDLLDDQDIYEEIKKLVSKLFDDSIRSKIQGRTVHIKIRLDDFTTMSRSKTFLSFVSSKKQIFESCIELFEKVPRNHQGIRLIGVGLSNLNTEFKNNQLTLNF